MNKETRDAFLAKWIPYGMNLLARAEAHGVDWSRMPTEQIEGAVILAEEWATPDEYKSSRHHFQNKE